MASFDRNLECAKSQLGTQIVMQSPSDHLPAEGIEHNGQKRKVLQQSNVGDISDPKAKIWPFKIHRANQIYDPVNNYLLQPKTVGEGGYWTAFDWDLAARLGSEAVGLDYSGEDIEFITRPQAVKRLTGIKK